MEHGRLIITLLEFCDKKYGAQMLREHVCGVYILYIGAWDPRVAGAGARIRPPPGIIFISPCQEISLHNTSYQTLRYLSIY